VKLAELLNTVRQRLEGAGVPSPRVDADLLISGALGLRRTDLYLHPERKIGPAEAERVLTMAGERAGRRPLQLVLGVVEFMSFPFELVPGVFIPRPETELLVEEVVRRSGGKPIRNVLDLCAGSGVVAVSLARLIRPGMVVASDVSRVAVETLRRNAILNRVADRVSPVAARGLEAFRWVGYFDLVVCNPPYVATGDVSGLEPEVRDYDPREALDGGPEGLDFIEGIVPALASIMIKGGLVGMEMGRGQAVRVESCFRRAGFVDLEVSDDPAGIPRVITGRSS
jgi:release factor glutamine methyltransferase